MTTKVLSALTASAAHAGDEFQGSGPHALFYTRGSASTMTLQVKDPDGDWQPLHAISSGAGNGVVIVHLVHGHDHRVMTPNAGFAAEAWIAQASHETYTYTGGV